MRKWKWGREEGRDKRKEVEEAQECEGRKLTENGHLPKILEKRDVFEGETGR